MERLFRRLACQVQVDPGRDGPIDVALAAAGAPAHRADRPAAIHQQRLAPQHFLDPGGKLHRAERLGQAAQQRHAARIPGFQRPLDDDAQALGQLHVVADLRMDIQRQVVR
ncbi:hypothetical protein D3C77_703140 [compost metagenome]